ncbi:hypothetical protein EV356DRAFT_451523 [Viridothelium virens]|uniref:Btz domain-containing protein n=1 Tax=Viridothelium virens TaxID=1048519 RepID=A0A6A6H1J7_VIRVR|nr:hypothetical protein EV356DRAFT_451523 [Viridothelium virens]
MPVRSRRDIVRRRRRVEEEGEDEASGAVGVAEDSLSEGSILSDMDEDADADADDSDLSETDGTEVVEASQKPVTIPTGNDFHGRENSPENVVSMSTTDIPFKRQTDTEAMMNGMNIPEESVETEVVDFEQMGVDSQPASLGDLGTSHTPSTRPETFADRKRREHEEYRKKRDSDPAFIPNRGTFFMHDHRTESPGQNGFKPFGKGRGRGRITVGGPFSPANSVPPASEPAAAKWEHDLHASHEMERPGQPAPVTSAATNQGSTRPPFSISQGSQPALEKQERSFSTQIGHAQIRLSLPGMKQSITFSAVPLHRHTRLPNHRPPLRRDKPVRISLPEQPPRYIFPSTERSFIFIPRALRPNQQGFGRGRLRGSYSAYGGYSSRRSSAYGGSIYSPSVALSRRSSLAREIPRDTFPSPTGSISARLPLTAQERGKPVVRLPGAAAPAAQYTPDVSVPSQGPHSVPLPQKPTYRENWPAQLPMHQPRPQKAISVTGIESPMSTSVHAPQQQEQQPFHQQVPSHMNGQAAPAPAATADMPTFYPHSRQMSHPSQFSGETPLSNIPERAIHAQPFQPPTFQQPVYPPTYSAQGGYFYAPANSGLQYSAPLPPGAVTVPVFVPAPYGQALPNAASGPGPDPNTSASGAVQSNMVAHEQNGMVYYYDPSQLYNHGEGYPATGYTVPGMGGMMTPSPDGYYYPQVPSGPVYYQAP